MKKFTIFYLQSILFLVLTSISYSQALKITPENIPDTTRWDFHGATMEYSYISVFQCHGNTHVTWDDVNKTYIINLLNKQVIKLNNFDDEIDKPYVDYGGKRGGDYLMTKIIDIRNSKSPYLTFLIERGGSNSAGTNTGFNDDYLNGPEIRVIENGNKLKEIQKPDQLLVEFITADAAHLDKLNNPKEEDWNVHPRRYGLPPVTGNPALSIFGGGGYRTGFLETDKDSALTFDEGLRSDYYDSGNDDRFERVILYIPEAFQNDGFIRVRFRVDAARNGTQASVHDDNDDFFLDDINLVTNGKPDIAINSVYIQNPYSILNRNTKYAIPFYANISTIYPIKSDSFKLKIRIKPLGQIKWALTPDEAGYTTEEDYSKILTFSADSSPKILSLPPIKISKFDSKYFGSNTKFQVWAVIMPSNGNSIVSNDTLFTDFSVNFSNVMAFDEPNTFNYFANFIGIPGAGLNLFGITNGQDIKETYTDSKLGFLGSGRIASRFEIMETDTIYGYQAYWAPLNQTNDDVEFELLAESGQPGALLVKESNILRKRGWDDIRKNYFFDEYVTCLLPKPLILKPGNYWLAISQLGMSGINLGGSRYKMAMVTTSYTPPIDTTKLEYWGNGGINLLLDRNLRKPIFNYSNPIMWINTNNFVYENVKGSGNWMQFTPTVGNPAYSHLNHAGTSIGNYNTYSRGTFVPMMRLFMDGKYSKWTDVNESKNDNEIGITPNPATDYIEISVPTDLNQRFKSLVQDVHVYFAFGEEVPIPNSFESVSSSVHHFSFRLDVSGFVPGVYFVKIGNKVQRFVKM